MDFLSHAIFLKNLSAYFLAFFFVAATGFFAAVFFAAAFFGAAFFAVAGFVAVSGSSTLVTRWMSTVAFGDC